jgi:hypothetical protein
MTNSRCRRTVSRRYRRLPRSLPRVRSRNCHRGSRTARELHTRLLHPTSNGELIEPNLTAVGPGLASVTFMQSSRSFVSTGLHKCTTHVHSVHWRAHTASILLNGVRHPCDVRANASVVMTLCYHHPDTAPVATRADHGRRRYVGCLPKARMVDLRFATQHTHWHALGFVLVLVANFHR